MRDAIKSELSEDAAVVYVQTRIASKRVSKKRLKELYRELSSVFVCLSTLSSLGKGKIMKRCILVCVLAVLCFAGCCPNYSRGERVGIVTKLSEKGFLFKSWEGELLVALPVDVAGTTQPEKFLFNVNPGCVDKVVDAMKSGKRVTIVYQQWGVCPPWIDDGHVVQDVQK